MRTRQVSKKARERKVAGTLEDELEIFVTAEATDGECDVSTLQESRVTSVNRRIGFVGSLQASGVFIWALAYCQPLELCTKKTCSLSSQES